ncbi:hypothetical protein [Fibrobacter succinogenes]|uniref:hypothetical protein n=1 Tax=Fibrobacter succinogenes TaxID=833 RepID=UPI001569B2E1|nr:hypothetical protein [Fibrobacter succinogenes]
MLFKRLFLVATIVFCTEIAFATENSTAAPPATASSPWQFEAGISAGRPTPIMLNAGVGYNNFFFRAMGGGLHLDHDEYWVGFRGSFAWKFFRGLPFSLDLGIGSGYAFANAPNGYLRTLNRANKKRLVRPYNYKESLDISVEMRANIYGVFTYVAIPIHCFMKHNKPTVIWQVGYAYRF